MSNDIDPRFADLEIDDDPPPARREVVFIAIPGPGPGPAPVEPPPARRPAGFTLPTPAPAPAPAPAPVQATPAPAPAPRPYVAPVPTPVAVPTFAPAGRPVDAGTLAPSTPAPARTTTPAPVRTTPVVDEGRIIAVEDRSTSTGEIVYWGRSTDTAERVSRTALSDALSDAGFPSKWAPAEVSRKVALRRAVQREAGREVVVKAIPRSGGAWGIYRKVGADYRLAFRVSLMGTDDIIGREGEGFDFDGPAMSRIRAEYNAQRANLSHEDVSAWLVDMAARLSAVPLRGRGGIYFVPRHNAERWGALGKVTEEHTGHKVYNIPAMRSADTVRSVIDSLTREVSTTVDEIRGEINAGEVTARKAKTRADALNALVRKVREYERLFGVKLAVADVSTVLDDLAKCMDRTGGLEVDDD